MIRINLLKPESKEIKEGPSLPGPEVKVKKAFPFTSIVILLIIAVLAVGFFLQKKMKDQENSRLQTAQAEKRKLQYVVAKLDELEKEKAVFEKKINLIKELKAQQDTAVRIMDELSRRLPDWVWLTEISYGGQLIQIRGNALSNNLIADYISNLQSCQNFNNVNLIASTQKTVRNTQFLEFSLTLNYVLPLAVQPQQKPGKPAPQPKKR